MIGNKKVDKIITSFCNKDKTKAEQKAIAKRNLAWPTFTLFIFTINIRCKGFFIREDSLIDLFLPEKCQISDEAKIRTDNYE